MEKQTRLAFTHYEGLAEGNHYIQDGVTMVLLPNGVKYIEEATGRTEVYKIAD